MEIIIGQTIEIVAALVLSAYFPFLVYSFFKYRLGRKQEELRMLLQRADLVSSFNLESLEKRLEKEFSYRDYLLPVSFLTIITLIGMALLIPSWVIYDTTGKSYQSLLLSGSEFWTDSEVFQIEKRNVSVVAFAIMGSYISGSRYIYRRFSTIDLTPGNFFSVGLRTIMAVLVSLMLAFILPDNILVRPDVILVVAFLTGIYPESGFQMLLNKVKIFPRDKEASKVNFSLDYVEGMSDMHKLRLTEVGIDNVQNLAQFNLILLIIKTPFPVRTLVDWCAQAKLIVEFRHEYAELQKAGIRTVLDLLDACKGGDPARIKAIAETSGISQLSIEVNYENMACDRSVALLNHFKHYLEQLKVSEKEER